MSAFEKLGIKEISEKEDVFSKKQAQTAQTFGFKWGKRNSYESPMVKENSRKWMLKRYCSNDEGKIKEWLGNGEKIIFDAGCGASYSAIIFFGHNINKNHYLGVDISDSVNVAKERFKEEGLKGDFLRANIMDLPMIPDNSVDIIFSEGVLKHTDSTEKAISYLSSKLKKNGLFMFYVYNKKAVVREFTDDHIRDAISQMGDEEAWEALYPLTKLGKVLGELNIELDVPEDIPYLGIKKGKIDIQRFFYWNICKLYYRSEFSIDEMNHVNFDWFRPSNCHRQTPDEVRKFCANASLEIEHFDVEDAGITVVARRK